MNTIMPDDIIAKLKIDNAADANLVRIVGLAQMQPNESSGTLLKRFPFANPKDAQLALAMIETVRGCGQGANEPRTDSRRLRGLTAALGLSGLLLVLVTGYALSLRLETQEGRVHASSQADTYAARLASLEGQRQREQQAARDELARQAAQSERALAEVRASEERRAADLQSRVDQLVRELEDLKKTGPQAPH